MSNGLNFNTILQVAEVALAAETGGASMALGEAAEQAMSQVATQAFSGALSQLGVSGDSNSMLTSAFSAGYGAATGTDGGSSNDLSNQIIDSAYQNGGLSSTSNNLSNQMAQLIDQLGASGQQQGDGTDGTSGKGGSAGQNWMEAIAKAMGDALGTLSQKVVDESQTLDSLAGNSSSSGAQQFQDEMAKFQADSQSLGMLSNAFANAIKSIGEGMQTMASKQ